MRLPAAHRHVNVHLARGHGLDYIADFGAGNKQDCHTIPNPNGWCVQLRRFDGSANPPSSAYRIRRIRIGQRHVIFWGDNANAGGWWMTWGEQGRAYAAWVSMSRFGPALQRLKPFVTSLRRLT